MNLTRTSCFLSLILRHKPETIGISLDEHGWANVDELIEGISKTREFNMDILEEIVRTDEKERFSINEDKPFIQYNQSHSIQKYIEIKKVSEKQSFELCLNEIEINELVECILLHKNTPSNEKMKCIN